MRIDLDPPLDLGDGQLVLSCEDTFYRVEVGTPSGGREVQAFPARAEATLENAAADIVTDPAPLLLADAEAEALLDTIVDEWAHAWGYASAARCVTYAGDPDQIFSAEGTAMLVSRSRLWVSVRATSTSPERPAYTEANIRAFAASFAPVRPSIP